MRLIVAEIELSGVRGEEITIRRGDRRESRIVATLVEGRERGAYRTFERRFFVRRDHLDAQPRYGCGDVPIDRLDLDTGFKPR